MDVVVAAMSEEGVSASLSPTRGSILTIHIVLFVCSLLQTASGLSSMTMVVVTAATPKTAVRRISATIWRKAAEDHQNRIYELLRPGMTDSSHELNSGKHRRQRRSQQPHASTRWTGLDPKHPVYNFLIEYYGLKGTKGVKRLARWSPNFCAADSGGVFLEGATAEDMAGTLHLRGAVLAPDGILYNPRTFFEAQGDDAAKIRAAAPYLWYRSVLQQTLHAEPVLHCHGLHEWAMQYQPIGAAAPPSARYQSHLPLRVDRAVLNAAVERNGVHCTHVDALRYFAPAASGLNYHGAVLHRSDQLRLEQPACVHAHMDLLKHALRLEPFGGGGDGTSNLLPRVLEIALAARSLDVASGEKAA
jgi:hypothetical protein